MNIVTAMKSSASQIALELWSSRFDLQVGMVSSVWREFKVEVHRISETEFILVLEDLPRAERYEILDTIKGIGNGKS